MLGITIIVGQEHVEMVLLKIATAVMASQSIQVRLKHLVNVCNPAL